MKIKKKYETIVCSNEHIFSIEYDGVVKNWKCVVEENEVVTYEGTQETGRMKIKNKERAPQVIQLDTVTCIYGEMIPFQLENGFPFIRLEDEWVPSDTFQEARMQAQIKMYKRQSLQEAVLGCVVLLGMLIYKLIAGDIGDWWIVNVFGIFFISSAAYRMARLRNELNAIREAEAEAEAEAKREQEHGSAVEAARAALEAAKTKES